jgi:ribosomal-protein-alanine N-acetyltransferase
MKIETERLILRKLKLSDWPDIVEGAGDYDVSKRTINIPHPYSRADAELFIKNTLKNWGKSSYSFCMELKGEKKVIGMMGLEGVHMSNGTANTGSWVNKKYWRQGFITEAKIAINDFAFDTLRLRRLNSAAMLTNKASNATQQKVGYVLEGLQRKGCRSKASGKVHDVNLYGLLKADWKKARTGLKSKQ